MTFHQSDISGNIGTDSNQRAEPSMTDLSPILVACESQGLADVVAGALQADQDVPVRALSMSLADLPSATELNLTLRDIIVFEIPVDFEQNPALLDSLIATGGPQTRFLAVTTRILSDETNAMITAAGVENVLPLMSETNTAPSDPAPEPKQPEQTNATSDTRETQGTQPASPAPLVQNAENQDRNGVIACITQTRGGIGATSLSLSLAALLGADPKKQKKGVKPPKKRVAYVDLDIQNGNAGAMIDKHERGTFLAALKAGSDMGEEFLTNALIPHDNMFDILPAPIEVAPVEALTPEMCAHLLDALRKRYDYIVIDLPRTIAHWIAPVLVRCDLMLIATDVEVQSVRQGRRMMDFFRDDNISLPIEFIVSMRKRPMMTSEVVTEAENFLEMPLKAWLPPDRKAADKAADQGKPLAIAAPRSSTTKAMMPIIKKLQEIHAGGKRRTR